MLKLNKHSNPTLSVLNVAAMIVALLRKDGVAGYADLLTSLKNSTSEHVGEIYNYALSFLFLVGKIEYLDDIDAIKLMS